MFPIDFAGILASAGKFVGELDPCKQALFVGNWADEFYGAVHVPGHGDSVSYLEGRHRKESRRRPRVGDVSGL
jgi:hypothetical protein